MSTNYFSEIGMWPRGHIGAAYAVGFMGSLALTLGAYLLAVNHVMSAFVLIPVLMVCACFQFVVQVLNFLHVSGETSSRERLVILLCAGVIMFILVLGSMWIMTNLDSRMMQSPGQMEQYMTRQEGI